MRKLSAIVAVAVLGVGCGSQPPPPPQQVIDTIGIKAQLLTIGRAEGQYLVAHSTYGTLAQLHEENLLTAGTELRGYTFNVEVKGSEGYVATATPSDNENTTWPSFVMDQTSKITER